MSRFSILILLGALVSAHAEAPPPYVKPGNYQVVGTLLAQNHKLHLVVFGQTRNLTNLEVQLPQDPHTRWDLIMRATAFAGHKVRLKGLVKLEGFSGTVVAQSISITYPDPRAPAEGDGFFKL